MVRYGSAILFEARRAAVIARLASSSGPPPRLGMALAVMGAWAAIGALATLLAVPVFAVLSHL